jgi:hypothetical protein
LAELLGGAPIFPGQSDLDQLIKARPRLFALSIAPECRGAEQTSRLQVQEVLGTPTDDERAWLLQHPDYDAVPLPRAQRRVPLEMALPDADGMAVELAARLLRYAAPDRIGAAAALCEAWFMRQPLPLPRRDLLQVMHL